MIYIENVFICIAAPLLVAALVLGPRYYRVFFFCLAGMAAGLLSAYINSFFVRVYAADLIDATTQIAPVVEGIMKLLPLLFYLLVFEPKARDIGLAVIVIATSYATFENIIYLIHNGAADLSFLLIRGFGTGAMHIVSGAIVGYGLIYVWPRVWLRVAGTFGLLCAAIIFHAIYNLLIAYGDSTQYIAYALPILTILIGMGAARLIKVNLHN